jgi:hypothetical protein
MKQIANPEYLLPACLPVKLRCSLGTVSNTVIPNAPTAYILHDIPNARVDVDSHRIEQLLHAALAVHDYAIVNALKPQVLELVMPFQSSFEWCCLRSPDKSFSNFAKIWNKGLSCFADAGDVVDSDLVKPRSAWLVFWTRECSSV